MSKKLVEKLTHLSKTTSGDEHGVLKKLLNKIIFDNNLENKLAFLISRYDRRRDASKKKSKTVIVNELTSDRISFKNFIFLVFEILRAKKMTIKVELEFSNKTTEHHIVVRPESTNNEKDNDDEKNSESNK